MKRHIKYDHGWARVWTSGHLLIRSAYITVITAAFFTTFLTIGIIQAFADNKLAHLETNQNYIEQLSYKNPLNINDVSSVLTFILNNLPDEVTVYPTENYYYFSFYNNGIKYAGNLRLDVTDRDEGKIHFAYFSAKNDWNSDLESYYEILGSEDGVKVEQLGQLKYRVGFAGRNVVFKLNDLTDVAPPAAAIAKNETFIGPVFDESALQFYLLYNSAIKNFHYILNQSDPVPDVLEPVADRDNILIGHRTGFAFYKDHFNNRLILIGIYERNAVLNNFFDGPFDQLPDNFISGDSLKAAFIDQNPSLKGKIDRFGNAPDGKSRISIMPYLYYYSPAELYSFDDCAQKTKKARDQYYACFNAENLVKK